MRKGAGVTLLPHTHVTLYTTYTADKAVKSIYIHTPHKYRIRYVLVKSLTRIVLQGF